MFSGIIEAIGEIINIEKEGYNRRLFVKAPFVEELYKGQSIAINGACLTIEKIGKETFEVVAVEETLKRTNLGKLNRGDFVNLERALIVGSRLDGHFVFGHIDTIIKINHIEERNGSFMFEFFLPTKYKHLLIPKGSIAINGTSLTVAELYEETFKVTIIPYTYEHTIFKYSKVGDDVNVEFDFLGKYVQRLLGK